MDNLIPEFCYKNCSADNGILPMENNGKLPMLVHKMIKNVCSLA